MPAGLVDDEDCVCAGIDLVADFLKMDVHSFRVALRHHDTCTLALLRADRAEYVGPKCALIMRCGRSRAPLGPAPRDLVLLPNSGFVLPPKLYFSAGGERLADRFDCVWETFLKSATASSFWA